jgi:hypothetical protein
MANYLPVSCLSALLSIFSGEVFYVCLGLGKSKAKEFSFEAWSGNILIGLIFGDGSRWLIELSTGTSYPDISRKS